MVQHKPHMKQISLMDEKGKVLLISNLNYNKVNPDVLFTLFGLYGNVLRVRFFYTKKDTALVQFATINHAKRAKRFLNTVSLYGKKMAIIPSKHTYIVFPSPTLKTANQCKDYTNSKKHRFKRHNSRNEQHVFPPSCILHLSNIPKNISKTKLVNLFQDHNKNIKNNIKIFGTNRQMALVRFNSVEIATHNLINLHNREILGNLIKVNFSCIKNAPY